MHLETTPAALSARASLSRAITGLEKRGCLAYRPHIWNDAERFFGWGYVLTNAGLVIGTNYEPVIPDLDYRIWLIDDNKHARGKEEVPAQWFNDGEGAPEFLASPGSDRSLPRAVSPPVRPDTPQSRIIDADWSEVAPEISFADRLRALAKQNDPDALRAGLMEIAAEIEGLSVPA